MADPLDPESQQLAAALVRQSQEAWGEFEASLPPRTRQLIPRVAVAREETAKPKWFVHLIPDVEDPSVQSFDTTEEVAAFLKTLTQTRGLRVFVFYGWEAKITKKPHQYMVHPDGTMVPLFDLPDAVEIQENGMLGPDIEEERTSTIGEPYEEAQGPAGEGEDEEWGGGEAEEPSDEEEIEEEEPAE